jgi:hypothetical protein
MVRELRLRRFPGLFVGAALLLGVTACSGYYGNDDTAYPDDDNRKQTGDAYQQPDSIFGSGGLNLFGSGGDEASAGAPDGGGIGVNSFLWRATLDTVAFMPLASADPFGGVIITDWYSPPQAPDERFKVNVLILSRDLRADGVRATVFKQRRLEGQWTDEPVDKATAIQLENAILTRARELRIAQL